MTGFVTQRRRSTLIAAALIVVLVVAGGLWWWRAHRGGLEFRAQFSAAVGIYPGNDVRILGVPVGTVDSVTPHGTEVTVSMTLHPGVDVRADTDAVIVAPNLVSDRYIALTGAYVHGPKLADGATIGLARTQTPLELDALYRSLTSLFTELGPHGANQHGSLSRLLQVGAANLTGNGARINRTVGDLSRSASTLAGSKQDIFATIDRLSQFTRTLAAHNSQLTSANNDLASVTGTLADDRGQFALALHNLARALLLAKTFVQQHRAALSQNVQRLSGTAKVLLARRASLARALASAPALLRNFLEAYDPGNKLLRGRADLNELTVWANAQLGGTTHTDAATSNTATTDTTTTHAATTAGATTDTASTDTARSSTPPPALLPGVGAPTDVP